MKRGLKCRPVMNEWCVSTPAKKWDSYSFPFHSVQLQRLMGLITNQYPSTAHCPLPFQCGCFGNSSVKGVRERERERKAARLSVLSCGNSRGSQGQGWGKTTQLCCNLCVCHWRIIVWPLTFHFTLIWTQLRIIMFTSDSELMANISSFTSTVCL